MRADADSARAISTSWRVATLSEPATLRRVERQAEFVEQALGACAQRAPVEQPQARARLAAEPDVLGDGQLGQHRELLVDGADAGRARLHRRAEANRLPVDADLAGARRGRRRRAGSSASTCRRRWRRSAHAPRRACAVRSTASSAATLPKRLLSAAMSSSAGSGARSASLRLELVRQLAGPPVVGPVHLGDLAASAGAMYSDGITRPRGTGSPLRIFRPSLIASWPARVGKVTAPPCLFFDDPLHPAVVFVAGRHHEALHAARFLERLGHADRHLTGRREHAVDLRVSAAAGSR